MWAIYQLLALRPPAYPDDLQRMLDPSESVRVRKAALQAFGAPRSPANLSLLRRGFEDPSPEVRRVAVEEAGLPEAVPFLRERFQSDPSHEVRLAIVRQLGEIATPAAIETLNAIHSQAAEDAVREEAERALATAGSKQTICGIHNLLHFL